MRCRERKVEAERAAANPRGHGPGRRTLLQNWMD